MPKTFTVAIIIIVGLLVLLGLGRQINDAIQISYRLDRATDEIVVIQDQNAKLNKKLEEVRKYTSVEETARNKLNMSRSNETVVVIPDESIDQILGLNKKVEEIRLPNWEGWWKLFFR